MGAPRFLPPTDPPKLPRPWTGTHGAPAPRGIHGWGRGDRGYRGYPVAGGAAPPPVGAGRGGAVSPGGGADTCGAGPGPDPPATPRRRRPDPSGTSPAPAASHGAAGGLPGPALPLPSPPPPPLSPAPGEGRGGGTLPGTVGPCPGWRDPARDSLLSPGRTDTGCAKGQRRASPALPRRPLPSPCHRTAWRRDGHWDEVRRGAVGTRHWSWQWRTKPWLRARVGAGVAMGTVSARLCGWLWGQGHGDGAMVVGTGSLHDAAGGVGVRAVAACLCMAVGTSRHSAGTGAPTAAGRRRGVGAAGASPRGAPARAALTQAAQTCWGWQDGVWGRAGTRSTPRFARPRGPGTRGSWGANPPFTAVEPRPQSGLGGVSPCRHESPIPVRRLLALSPVCGGDPLLLWGVLHPPGPRVLGGCTVAGHRLLGQCLTHRHLHRLMVDGGAGTAVCQGWLERARAEGCRAPSTAWGSPKPPQLQKGFTQAVGIKPGAGPCPTPQELPVC